MWTYFKTKKLSILAILAGLTYSFMIVAYFYDGWDDFQMGFSDATQSEVHNKWGDVIGHKPVESYSFFVKPKKGFSSYPDSLVNLKTNKFIKTKYSEMIVLVPKSNSLPIVSEVFIGLLAILICIVFIRIPIHFYRLMGLIEKEFIFERKSIRLLRWLSIELLIVYFGSVLFSYFVHQSNCSLFAFSEYNIVVGFVDPLWLLLGIVVLLIAEILSKTLVIKEEQELTI